VFLYSYLLFRLAVAHQRRHTKTDYKNAEQFKMLEKGFLGSDSVVNRRCGFWQISNK